MVPMTRSVHPDLKVGENERGRMTVENDRSFVSGSLVEEEFFQ
jgi:hypothetical protein